MDQASASPAASCAHNPAAPRTLPSWQPFEDQAQTVGPPPARSSPRSEPHSEPVHIVPRPSSPALCQSDAKGYLLPDFYSGCAIGISGRLTEGLLLWRSHFRASIGILRHARTFGRERLEAACDRALEIGARSYTSVTSILKSNLDRKRPAPVTDGSAITHTNIRCPRYFR